MALVQSMSPRSAAAVHPLRIMFYSALFLAAVGLGAATSHSLFGLPFAMTTADDVAAEIDRFSENNPGAGAMFVALRENYPSTYADLTVKTAAALRKGDLDGVEIVAFDTTRALSKAKGPALAHASPEKLHDWGKSALAVMNAAKSASPRLCAQVAFGRVERNATTPALANAAGRLAAATIAGFHEGETKPRAYAAPSPADQAMVARAVAAQGLSATERQSLKTEGRVKALSDREQCALGLKLMRAVVSTPEPVRSRILSQMAAQAARQL